WRTAAAPANERQDTSVRRPHVRPFPSFRDTFVTLRANVGLESPYGRLAIRLAVTLGAADAIARAFAIEHGYWMILTAALVLKPDYTTTLARGVARVAGTLAGAALAGVIALVLHPLGHADIALCALFAGLGYLAFNANYALFTVTITGFVVFAFSVLGESGRAALVERLVSTLYGSALAAVATFAWPTWEGGRTRDRLAALIEAERLYAIALLDLYVAFTGTKRHAVNDAQTAAWAARAAAEASVDRLLAEPARFRALDGNDALTILTASRRFAIALLSLNSRAATVNLVPRPSLTPFRDALDATLTFVVGSLHQEPTNVSSQPLRPIFARTREILETTDAADASNIVPDLDALVDSANALVELTTLL
ncbi:MAG: FUSC family protein, partial [Candidatus Eremiobacteraeota bacterium]|nr:FUSC family protein [Candidatus Eremiobacteraeota bacterium]